VYVLYNTLPSIRSRYIDLPVVSVQCEAYVYTILYGVYRVSYLSTVLTVVVHYAYKALYCKHKDELIA